MGHPSVPPLSPLGAPAVSPMDSWVLEETKKLEAQQRVQQRKLLDLKQVRLGFSPVVPLACFFLDCKSVFVLLLCLVHCGLLLPATCLILLLKFDFAQPFNVVLCSSTGCL